MARLTADLADVADCVFPDGPHTARGPPTDDNPFPPPHYEWWDAVRSPDGWRYEGAESTLALVARLLTTGPPFDGLLGFSQGCILASIVLRMVEARSPLLAAAASLPSFGIFFCGIPPRALPPAVSAAVGGARNAAALPPLAAPSLHVIGRRDPAAPLSRALAASFVAPIVIEHERGHVIPRLPAGDVATVRAFLAARAGGEPPPAAAGVSRL
jgi:hypothetical protein